MAKQKKTGKKSRDKTVHLDPQAQAEAMARGVSESAQQIWLAGVGAFARAQSEGNKVFESLVREGIGFEKTARKVAGDQADSMRAAMESRMGEARERASETWKRLEGAFEERVRDSLSRLGVPTRADLSELSAKVDALAARSTPAVRRAPARKPATAKKAATPRKAATKTPRKAVAKKATGKKAAAKKATTRAVSRRTPSARATTATAPKARRPRKA